MSFPVLSAAFLAFCGSTGSTASLHPEEILPAPMFRRVDRVHVSTGASCLGRCAWRMNKCLPMLAPGTSSAE